MWEASTAACWSRAHWQTGAVVGGALTAFSLTSCSTLSRFSAALFMAASSERFFSPLATCASLRTRWTRTGEGDLEPRACWWEARRDDAASSRSASRTLASIAWLVRFSFCATETSMACLNSRAD